MLSLFAVSRNRALVILSAFLALSAGGSLAQDSVEFTGVAEGAATVTAIDQANRLITLRGPEGGELTVEAGPEVRNFAQIGVGDIVRLRYEEYYRAAKVDPEQVPGVVAAAAVAAERAAEGEQPGVALGAYESVIVTIESIGPDGRSATFIYPNGAIEAIYVRREESQAFASSLMPGDLVELTVAEAIALVVEPLGDD